jgi:hypothetical protein
VIRAAIILTLVRIFGMLADKSSLNLHEIDEKVKGFYMECGNLLPLFGRSTVASGKAPRFSAIIEKRKRQ